MENMRKPSIFLNFEHSMQITIEKNYLLPNASSLLAKTYVNFIIDHSQKETARFWEKIC